MHTQSDFRLGVNLTTRRFEAIISYSVIYIVTPKPGATNSDAIDVEYVESPGGNGGGDLEIDYVPERHFCSVASHCYLKAIVRLPCPFILPTLRQPQSIVFEFIVRQPFHDLGSIMQVESKIFQFRVSLKYVGSK